MAKIKIRNKCLALSVRDRIILHECTSQVSVCQQHDLQFTFTIDDNDDDCWSLTATHRVFSYIGKDSNCCFCQRLMIKSIGVRMTVRKGGLGDTLGNRTQGNRTEIVHAIYWTTHLNWFTIDLYLLKGTKGFHCGHMGQDFS